MKPGAACYVAHLSSGTYCFVYWSCCASVAVNDRVPRTLFFDAFQAQTAFSSPRGPEWISRVLVKAKHRLPCDSQVPGASALAGMSSSILPCAKDAQAIGPVAWSGCRFISAFRKNCRITGLVLRNLQAVSPIWVC